MPARRARITQAEIARAIRAARAEGCPEIIVRDGVIRIPVDASAASALPSAEPQPGDARSKDETACDAAFGIVAE